MAISIPSDQVHHRPLSPNAALRQAWYWYLSLLFIPFALFIADVIVLNMRDGSPSVASVRDPWFIASIAFMFFAGPLAFWVRSKFFKPYWRGEPVHPRAYLSGMLIVWFTFEIGGIVSLVGCLMGNSLLPCLLPALAAFFFFTPLWPNGRAMAHPTGDSDDPEIYQEPR